MNDVVIKVKENATDATKLDIELCCTGASFGLKVYLDQTCLFNGKEVHVALGNTGGNKFVNTVMGETQKGVTLSTITATIAKPTGFSFGTADFWIQSPKGNIHIAGQGEDPHGVAIPKDWQWPTEWTRITEAYPNFATFATDATDTSDEVIKWYDYPVADKVFSFPANN